MIDMNKARKVFKEYIKNYNPEDEQIKIKIAHIERTAIVAKKLAESLGLNKEDIELAELIGLLHDIGRFEQIKRYHTMVDRDSINHGEFGVHILFNENLIYDFIDDRQYDSIIKVAILNHNRNKIEEGLTKRELLHSKIIRDSDKTDIFYILTFGDNKAIYGSDDISDQKITDEIYREFVEDKSIQYKYRETGADILVSHFAYIYDFNYKYGLKVINENDYLEKLYERYNFSDPGTDERYQNIYKIARQYLDMQLAGGNNDKFRRSKERVSKVCKSI